MHWQGTRTGTSGLNRLGLLEKKRLGGSLAIPFVLSCSSFLSENQTLKSTPIAVSWMWLHFLIRAIRDQNPATVCCAVVCFQKNPQVVSMSFSNRTVKIPE